MARLLVFDVNETLLDLRALDPHFERIFGDAAVRQRWFQQVLQSALVATIAGPYRNFGEIAGMALEMTGAREGVDVADEERSAVLGAVRVLPPHDDVVPSLEKLRNGGAADDHADQFAARRGRGAAGQRRSHRFFRAGAVGGCGAEVQARARSLPVCGAADGR